MEILMTANKYYAKNSFNKQFYFNTVHCSAVCILSLVCGNNDIKRKCWKTDNRLLTVLGRIQSVIVTREQLCSQMQCHISLRVSLLG